MKQTLTFYCRDCDFVFDSLPDGTGYEQAECPKCKELCMTVAFEQQEQERHRNEATFFSLLGSLTGLFHVHVPGRQQRRDTSAPVTIGNYEDRLDAEKDADLLARQGIEATLDLNTAGDSSLIGGTSLTRIELKVLSVDVRRAEQILREKDPPALPPKQTPPRSVEDVTFACEECGQMISFPRQRRGGVETCPNCFQHVDVPND